MAMYKNPDFFDRDRYRANLLTYTRKAFRILPPIANPRILDIGCGSGISTLELVRISGGTAVALDIDRGALDRLTQKAERGHLSGRVTVMHSSMLEMDFPRGSFDIIWSEGSIVNIGFERGLKEWGRFLVPGGYLVIHDAVMDLQKKNDLVRDCGYETLGQFELSSSIWWKKYYEPLKQELETMQGMDLSDKGVIDAIKTAEREISEFDFDDDRFGSVFFVLKNI